MDYDNVHQDTRTLKPEDAEDRKRRSTDVAELSLRNFTTSST